VATYVNINLMQTPGGGACAVSIAHEMLKMQDDPLRVIRVACEGVQSFWGAAPVKDGVANLGRKAVNMLRIVTIFRVKTAAFC
jgi:hypothetical protein